MLRQIVHLLKSAYLPKPFTKGHAVAMIYGVCIGGFVGGTVAAGMAEGQYWWATLLGVIAGMAVGVFLALQLVPKRNTK